MDDAKLYWVAGILEGEGCFGINRRKAGRPGHEKMYENFRIEVNMTDEDIIRRMHAWTGMGYVNGPYSYKKHPEWTPTWHLFIQRKAEAEPLARAVFPLMGVRRQQQIRTAFERLGLAPLD